MEKLCALQRQRGMSLRKVAAELELAAHGWITQIERSEHKSVADRIVKIAHLFEISADRLLMDDLDLEDAQPSQPKTPDG